MVGRIGQNLSPHITHIGAGVQRNCENRIDAFADLARSLHYSHAVFLVLNNSHLSHRVCDIFAEIVHVAFAHGKWLKVFFFFLESISNLCFVRKLFWFKTDNKKLSCVEFTTQSIEKIFPLGHQAKLIRIEKRERGSLAARTSSHLVSSCLQPRELDYIIVIRPTTEMTSWWRIML